MRSSAETRLRKLEAQQAERISGYVACIHARYGETAEEAMTRHRKRYPHHHPDDVAIISYRIIEPNPDGPPIDITEQYRGTDVDQNGNSKWRDWIAGETS